MTDRELLERAAKAAGIVVLPHLQDPNVSDLRVFGGHWNPLADDGDALRLAVKLMLRVQCEGTISTVYTPTGNRYCWNEAAIVEGDPYAATRRAIVRAAAELG